MDARVFGMDLGTTNSSVAVGTAGGVESIDVPQLVEPGRIDELPVLPSFLRLAVEGDERGWVFDGRVAGAWARQEAGRNPGKVVSSAKSWLCHRGGARGERLLPLSAAGDEKVSAVEASAHYLKHLAAAARRKGAGGEVPLFVVAVPASFDQVARELTLQAAEDAGLSDVLLVEEPQAAFYAWLDVVGDAWREVLGPGDVVLVCDVGGGTTDFTLIEVTDRDGELELERVAVGEHILLGGDNMDLALAVRMRDGNEGVAGGFSSSAFQSLWAECRRAKESLLSDTPPDAEDLLLPGEGSSFVAASRKLTLPRKLVEEVVLDGFFPVCDASDVPCEPAVRAGLEEFGLPYAKDPAVTRHLAAFLARHGRTPTHVLFNGGVFKAAALRARTMQVLRSWFGDSLVELEGGNPDLAVSRGAARYGLVRRGHGVRIRGGTARSYYVGVESSMPAVPGFTPPTRGVCVVSKGTEEGTEYELGGHVFTLRVGEPSTFRFFSSTVREDEPGTVVEDVEEAGLKELPPLEAAIEDEDEGAASVPVKLRSVVTAVGTVELWCTSVEDPGRKWRLEFDIRGEEGR